MTQSLVLNSSMLSPVPDFFGSIRPNLEEVERVLTRTLKSRYAAVAPVVNHVHHFRGKRLRPALLLLVARASGKFTPAHAILGAVVEMIHTATLVHDDILDNSRIRRHVATVNSGWGTQTAVLLGDYLFTHAFHLASTLEDVRACRIIGKATNRVCEGELCQGLEQGNLELEESTYFEIIDGKTAELIACACQLGALYSGAADSVVASMTRFGRQVGLAFQIADDLLDLVGEEAKTGKSLGTDLQQLKLTLPVIHLLHQGPSPIVERARQILSGPNPQRSEELRACLMQSGSFDYAKKKAEELISQARRELLCLTPSPDRTLLEIMAERVINRDQ